MSQQKGNSKRARRSPHSGRSRGSEIQTGNRGGPRVRLSVMEKALTTKYLDQKIAAMRRRTQKEGAR